MTGITGHHLVGIDANGAHCSTCGRVPDFKQHIYLLTCHLLGVTPTTRTQHRTRRPLTAQQRATRNTQRRALAAARRAAWEAA